MRGPSEKRRKLRRRSTPSERLLWGALRNRRVHGLNFRRQHSIAPFIVDFACIERKLVIEIDGGYHEWVEKEDAQRQRFLEQAGFQVLRFSDTDVMADVEAVVIAIVRLAEHRPRMDRS